MNYQKSFSEFKIFFLQVHIKVMLGEYLRELTFESNIDLIIFLYDFF